MDSYRSLSQPNDLHVITAGAFADLENGTWAWLKDRVSHVVAGWSGPQEHRGFVIENFDGSIVLAQFMDVLRYDGQRVSRVP